MPGQPAFAERHTFVESAFLVPERTDEASPVVRLPYDQLSVFAHRIENGAPLTRMPLLAVAHLSLDVESVRQIGSAAVPDPLFTYPLGVVGTDHVGYASFDLWVLRHSRVINEVSRRLSALGLIGTDKPSLTVELKRLLVYPFKDRSIAFDALSEGAAGPNFLLLQITLDEIILAERGSWPPMPAMQTPGILDWRLSPGSFSMTGALLVGEDGCETLLPGNLATRLVRFHQIVKSDAQGAPPAREQRIRNAHRDRGDGDIEFTDDVLYQPPELPAIGKAIAGYLVEYRSEWFPLGHSLGRLAYSLPLAPAEKLQIAVVDWARKESAARTEQTGFMEQLNNDTLRDRSLSEAVEMVVREAQGGSSFMAGQATSAGAGASLGVVGLGAGATNGLGFATSSTEGTRSLVGNTTQHISDAFHQAASALRELNSTVIVQGSQAETAGAKTRTIANYNHSHALTMLYYEVVHHERVVTRVASVTPLLLLQHTLPDFDYRNIEANLAVISAVLRDAGLRDCLKVVSDRACRQANLTREQERRKRLGGAADEQTLDFFRLRILTGATAGPITLAVAVVSSAGGAVVPCMPVDPGIADPSQRTLVSSGLPQIRFAANTEFMADFVPVQMIRRGNVQAIQLTTNPLGRTVGPDWIIQEASATGPDAWAMFRGAPSPDRVPMNVGTSRLPVAPFEPTVMTVDDLLSDEERCCLRRLLLHMNSHKGFYWRHIFMAEDPADRAIRLAKGWNGVPLADLVENRLVDMVGDLLAFPLATGMEGAAAKALHLEPWKGRDDLVNDDYVEQLLSIPTRGVFAEAKLGHCNASELIDPTRFWDWQISPIPDDAPSIVPVDTGTRAKAPEGTTPTAFPGSLVNIVNPPALPDPTGFGAAGGILSALGPFRDMSGMKELGSFLQTLSNNATQLAAEGLKQGGTGALMNLIKDSPELTPAQKADLIGNLLGNRVGSPPTTGGPPSSSAEGGRSPDAAPPPGQGPGTQGVPPSAPPPTSSPLPTQQPSQPKMNKPLSAKSRTLLFYFTYGNGELMPGSWRITLKSAIDGEGAIVSDTLEDSTGKLQASGVGDKITMKIPSSYGGQLPVDIEVDGSAITGPATLYDGPMKGGQPIKVSSDVTVVPRHARKPIPASSFQKTSAYTIVQPTMPVSFKVIVGESDTTSSMKAKSDTSGWDVTGEGSFTGEGSLGGQAGPVNIGAKRSVTLKLTGKYSNSETNTDQQTTTAGGTVSNEISFTGTGIDFSKQPQIDPL
jgi:hypothetical protein